MVKPKIIVTLQKVENFKLLIDFKEKSRWI